MRAYKKPTPRPLAWIMMFDAYELSHAKLPGNGLVNRGRRGTRRLQKKRRSKILAWWWHLQEEVRDKIEDTMDCGIAAFNDGIKERQASMLVQIERLKNELTAWRES